MDDKSTRPDAFASEQGEPGGANSALPPNGESAAPRPGTPGRTITSKRVVIPADARRAVKRVKPEPIKPAPVPSAETMSPPAQTAPSAQTVNPPESFAPASETSAPSEQPTETFTVAPEPVVTQTSAAETEPESLAAMEPAALMESPTAEPVAAEETAAADSAAVGSAEETALTPAPLVPSTLFGQPKDRPLESETTTPVAEGIHATGTPYQLDAAALAPSPIPQRRRRRVLEFGLWGLAAILFIVALLAFLPIVFPNTIPNILPLFGDANGVAPTETTGVSLAPTSEPSATATIPPTADAATPVEALPTEVPLIIPTPPADGTQLSLLPNLNVTGWYEDDETAIHYGDANLHAGTIQTATLASVMQFNLRNLPTDSHVLYAALELTGRDASRLGIDGQWQLEILDTNLTTNWGDMTPQDLAQIQSLGTFGDPVPASALGVGRVTRFVLDDSALQLIDQQFKNGNLVLRLRGPSSTSDNVFTWESGAGTTAVSAPTLHLVVVPGQYAVVTNTPEPQNVLTAAAYVVRGTDSAKRNGTPTPFPPGVATGTPGGGVVTVAAETAIPGNDQTAIARAQFATAVAQTTGTFTPVPQTVVIIFPTDTPVVIAPENLATPTATPPDADLANIPIDYEHCGCKNTIIALSTRFGDPKPAPIVMSPDGQALGKLSSDLTYRIAEAHEPYSPDGTKKIAYPQDSKGVQQIGYEDVATGDITFLTKFAKGVAYDAVWAPDNSAIVFVATIDARADQLWLYDFGTGTYKVLVKTTGAKEWYKHPSWSPDSQQIAYWSSVSGHDQIWVMNRDGTNQHNISNNDFDETDPVWVK